ncbi:hypothetical protein EMPS_10715 [Entomortierella parvispora]|uniref:MD-2-related lipid-recognition domain-containing protein n=1 Tax=Entomortierella parvispora TaxID=205924 RepID=A0A9P3M199_9FUNG|nr:hypothetical protein EMPS_10715 [Entomortierella parvispora]
MKFLSILPSLALVALATSAPAATPGVGPFKTCTGESHLTVSSVSITPAVPCAAQKYCLTVTGQLSEDITQGATLNVVGRYFNRVVYIDKQDIGTLLAEAGTPLPFPASAPGTNSTVSLCMPFLNGFGFLTGLPLRIDFQAKNGNQNILYCQYADIVAAQC